VFRDALRLTDEALADLEDRPGTATAPARPA
jgi:hypothetical protein